MTRMGRRLRIGLLTVIIAASTVGGGLTNATSPAAAAPAISDITPGQQFYEEMVWAVENDLLELNAQGQIRPLESVTREVMAGLLYKLAGSPAFTPPATSPFSDVPTSNPKYKAITWIASEQISTGWPDGTFRPSLPVARDAMSAFLYRLGGRPSFTPPSTSPFSDVTPSTQFYLEMTWMRSIGISTGWPDGTFKPLNTTARDAMSAFAKRFDGPFLGADIKTWTGSTPGRISEQAATAWGSATTAVLTDTGMSPIATTLAGSIDSPLIIHDSGTTAASIRQVVQALGVSDIVYVGSPNSFDTTFRNALSSVDTSPTLHLAARAIDVSNSVLGLNANLGAVVTVSETDTSQAKTAATAVAVLTDTPLAMVSSSDPESSITSYAQLTKHSDHILISPRETLPVNLFASDATGQVTQQSYTLDDYMGWLLEASAMNIDARRVVAAPLSDLPSSMVAISRASFTSQAFLPVEFNQTVATGTAPRYAELWGPELGRVELVAPNTRYAHAASLGSPSMTLREAVPSFRAVSATVAGSNFLLGVTKPTGSARVAALDSEGLEVASTTGTSLTVPGAPRNLVIVALRGDGSELDYFDFKANDFTSANPAFGTAATDKVQIVAAGSLRTPRLVLRHEIDPSTGETLSAAVPVAFTCEPVFTQANPSTSKQWRYEFVASASETTECGAASDIAGAGGLQYSGLVFPAITAPASGAAVAGQSTAASRGQAEGASRRPSQSLVEQSISFGIESLAESELQRGPGDDWSDFVFRYDTYITDRSFPVAFSVSGITGVLYGGGDDRTPERWSDSHRYRMEARLGFGGNHYIDTSYRHMGPTKIYGCTTVFSTNCPHVTRTQSVDTVWTTGQASGPTTARWTWNAESPNPFAGPGITAQLSVSVQAGKTVITGTHEMMPRHEIAFGPVPGHFQTLYVNKWSTFRCLLGRWGGTDCIAHVNVTL